MLPLIDANFILERMSDAIAQAAPFELTHRRSSPRLGPFVVGAAISLLALYLGVMFNPRQAALFLVGAVAEWAEAARPARSTRQAAATRGCS